MEDLIGYKEMNMGQTKTKTKVTEEVLDRAAYGRLRGELEDKQEVERALKQVKEACQGDEQLATFVLVCFRKGVLNTGDCLEVLNV